MAGWTKIAELLGPAVELRHFGDYLQWRVAGTTDAWANLLPLSAIQGLPGTGAVPADAAVAGYISTLGTSETQTAADARYTRKTHVRVNVMDFGAVGDGVANDTAALNSAIAVAAVGVAAGMGGTVYLPRGTYLAYGVTLSDHVHLEGDGIRATRIQGAGATTVLTLGTGNIISNLALRGDSTAGSIGLQTNATDSHHWTMVDCFISGFGTGISITQSYIISITRVTIQACTIGIRTYGNNVNAVYVLHGEIQGCVDGVKLEASASKQINFTGATIEGNTGYGINQTASTYTITVRDCYFESNDLGSYYQTGQSRGLVISGCSFDSRGAYGIYMTAGVDTTIEGNTFRLTDVGAKSIYMNNVAIQRTTVARNWYQPGYEFVPATMYGGTELLHLDRQLEFPVGVQFKAGTTAAAPFRIPHGVAPTTPVNGDMWTTSAGLFVRINGVTKTVTLT